MRAALIIVANFVLGSVPFAVLVGRALRGVDITRYGDHNPGTYNALRAGGLALAAPAMILEFLKGHVSGLLAQAMMKANPGTPWWVWVLAVAAPIAGHAFSPFLRFRGGKALAVTLGVWTAIAGWPAMLSYTGVICAQELTWPNAPDAFKVGLGMVALAVSMYVCKLPARYGITWTVNLAIIMIKQVQYETVFQSTAQRYGAGINDNAPGAKA
ncbi:MAG: glycerol-3-phosphate acyltransferase [Clostridia bacterium]|nr:glycerol-3-phosphate acyltransferase [Clostridia bacterium]